ncbi:hypothetical protein IE81DRAFT_222797 [Ceraceosorus guamensis]|uniref:Uncharacterized protein n=1 Tax=Ceraceosorus guamensis TaxID=1522189 RepID=A0A316VRZ6_9BASI|nr:hypothetical protein IE81DRAFT_222797 [Ceraceosorus guamensis]PWN40376.1 hypothetical protein IE81DRAFT_222797 [Ceraceosorus guamensis]
MTAAGIVAAASAWGGGKLLWHWGKNAMAARQAYQQRQQQLRLERNAVLGIPVPEVHRVLHAEIGGSRTPSPVVSGSSSPRAHLPNESHHSSNAAETSTIEGAGSPRAQIPAGRTSTTGEVELSRVSSSGSGPHAHTPADTASSSGASTQPTTVQHRPATPSLPANAPPGTAWGHVTQHADGVPYLPPSP